MRARITKVFRFEAAHHLPNHDGKCRLPHGHSYKVEVVCEDVINAKTGHPKEGMVVDFADIKAIWNTQLKPLLDHQDLNISLQEEIPTTTAENIAAWVLNVFQNAGVPIYSVAVWETETSKAEVSFKEAWINGPLTRRTTSNALSSATQVSSR